MMGSPAMPQGSQGPLTINTQQAQMMNGQQQHPGMSSVQLQQQSQYQQSPLIQHRIVNGQQYPMMNQHVHQAPQAMMVNGHGSPGLPPNSNQARR